MNNEKNKVEHYLESCRKDFWQEVFQIELEYLVKRLKDCRDILSIGCGPAHIEGELARRGFSVTGMDVSQEALANAPDAVRTVVARAENIPLPASSFDAVVYVASLQFIDDYRKAIAEATRVLRPNGKLIVMLLNPRSDFFKRKFNNPGSYVGKIKHLDLSAIETVIAENFESEKEYFLGIKDDIICESNAVADAALFIINGRKKPMQKDQNP